MLRLLLRPRLLLLGVGGVVGECVALVLGRGPGHRGELLGRGSGVLRRGVGAVAVGGPALLPPVAAGAAVARAAVRREVARTGAGWRATPGRRPGPRPDNAATLIVRDALVPHDGLPVPGHVAVLDHVLPQQAVSRATLLQRSGLLVVNEERTRQTMT